MSKLPPMVKPIKQPGQIIDFILLNSEKESMIKFLIGYHKIQTDWDVYRKKIPDELLVKWAVVMKECRENGFMAPKIQGNVIVWKKVFGFKRNQNNADKCTLCSKAYVSGECEGKLRLRNMHRVFIPCWQETGIPF